MVSNTRSTAMIKQKFLSNCMRALERTGIIDSAQTIVSIVYFIFDTQ